MIVLRDYQQELVDKINSSKTLRNCVQSPTGSGKTIIFSHLANTFIGRVLILVNRTELLEQTKENIDREYSLIKAGSKKTEKTPVTIGMVESVYNRQKKGLIDVNDFDLIIVDEIQNLQFTKVFEGYENRLLGFTATPVIDKKEHYTKCCICNTRHETKVDCCGGETYEYSKPITLKKWYGELITGTPISKLIEVNKLVEVHNFVCDNPNLDKLKTDKNDQYTKDSETEAFENFASLENLILNYEEHCVGLKTMVFNTTIEGNRLAYEEFLKLGYNVKSFDSKSKEKRADLVEWFRNTKDSVLMSVGVFTTGFDVDDVEAIIMNRATKSLSLYHQIVGRGGRPTTKIFKPYFKLIDLGGNVGRFDSWSNDVDWNKLYNNKREKKKQSPDTFVICPSCGYMTEEMPCPECGFEPPKKGEGDDNGNKTKIVETSIATEFKKLPKPKTYHILNHAISHNLDINEAKNITAKYIVDMFRFAKTPYELVHENWEYINNEIKEMIRPIYFALINSDLKGNKVRTLNDFHKKVTKQILKYYEDRV
jgi:superfamily II DNA or RNA helicase